MTRNPVPLAFRPKAPLELAGHLHMAAYLHSAFPGGNPRPILKAKGVATKWEPAHPWLQWWHTPNGGSRSGVREGAQLKRMGTRSGVADFALLVRLPGTRWEPAMGKGEGRGRHVPVVFGQSAFVEVKREGVSASASKLNPAQERFRDDVQAAGAWWAECRTVDELDAALHQWLDPWGLTWPRPRNVGLSPVVKPGSV